MAIVFCVKGDGNFDWVSLKDCGVGIIVILVTTSMYF